MNSFLLNDEEINGSSQLELFKHFGTECVRSKFSYYASGDEKEWGIVYTLWDSKSTFFIQDSSLIRPVIPYSSIAAFCHGKYVIDERFMTVNYGEIAYDFIDADLHSNLEELYSQNKLKPLEKTFTFFTCNDDNFVPQSFPVYEYDGKKYFRRVCKLHLRDPEICWFAIEPMTWYVDINEDIAITSEVYFPKIPIPNNIKITRNGESYLNKIMNIWLSEIISDEEKMLMDKTINNIYNFDFRSLSEEEIIRGAIVSNIPVYLHGKSSVGKSSRVKQLDPDCEIVYLANASKESLIGKSIYNSETKKMEDVPPTWYLNIKEKCEREPNKIHIIFFDELTHASYEFQNMLFNIVLDHNINGKWTLPLNARIVAAGNEKSESISANEMVEQLFSRCAHVYINTTVEKWLEWAITPEESYERLDYVDDKQTSKIHPAIYSFVAYKDAKGENVLNTSYTGDYANADPRKWEMASKVLYNTKEPEMLRALIGNKLTNDFIEFVKQKGISIADVINHNYSSEDLNMNLSECYATVASLSFVDDEHFEVARDFMRQFGDKPTTTFENMWASENKQRLKRLKRNI